jgi:hypothetical protein
MKGIGAIWHCRVLDPAAGQFRQDCYRRDGSIVAFCPLNRTVFANVLTLTNGMVYALCHGMKWRKRIRRTSIILTLYGIGLLEAYYLPRYGIEWMLAGIGTTAVLAGFWMRRSWDA